MILHKAILNRIKGEEVVGEDEHGIQLEEPMSLLLNQYKNLEFRKPGKIKDKV